MRKINFNDILKKYDINALIQVVEDRVRDFDEHVIGSGYGENYPLSYCNNLQQALGLLYDIKLCQELSNMNLKS
jgi:hypothetical protein